MPDRGLHQVLRVPLTPRSSEGSLNQHIKLKHPEVFRGSDKDFVVKEYDNEDDDSA
jgi:hypothetical protein